MAALLARARVAVAEGDRKQAERDAHDALACAASSGCIYILPTSLSALPISPERRKSERSRASFRCGRGVPAAHGEVRFKVHQAGYEASVAALRDAMDEQDFDAAWAEGAALSTEEAIAYAQRGRGERKRPNSGWESLTPAEHDVVRLVCDGLRQQGHRHAAFRLTQDRASPPHARLHQTRAQLARPAGSRGSPPRLSVAALRITREDY